MPRTCAICGERDATRVTGWEGRPVPACACCATPPVLAPPRGVTPDAIADAFAAPVLRGHRLDRRTPLVRDLVRLFPGRTVGELFRRLGLGGGSKVSLSVAERRAYERLVTAVVRARRQGEVRAVGTWPRQYYPAAALPERGVAR
jgi:hypothetical protein